MAKYKSLLKAVEVVTAGRKRKCYHSPKHNITKGDNVLQVQERFAKRGYCQTCGAQMLRVAQERLDELRDELLGGD